MSDIADKIIKQLRPAEFPSLPELLVRELDMLGPDTPAVDREAMAAGDLFLSARMQAETAAGKHPDLDDSIRACATRLGFTRLPLTRLRFLKQLYLQSSLGRCLAEELARQVLPAGPEQEDRIRQAGYCGLFLNVGALALEQIHGSKYLELLQESANTRTLLDKELEAFGIDHAELGAALLRSWGVDSFRCDAVRYHHQAVDSILDATLLVRIAWLANQLADEQEPPEAAVWADTLFDLKAEALAGVRTAARSRLEQVTSSSNIAYTSTRYLPLPQREDEQVLLREKGAWRELQERIEADSLFAPTRARLARARKADDLKAVLGEAITGLFGDYGFVLFAGGSNQETLTCLTGSAEGLASEPLTIHCQAERSTVARSCVENRAIFRLPESDLTVIDRQITSLLCADNFCCEPCCDPHTGEVKGVLVIGIGLDQAEKYKKQNHLRRLLGFELGACLGELGQTGPSATQDVAAEYDRRIREAIHEANNPLGIIKNYLQLLSMKQEGDTKVQSEISFIKSEIDRVSKILDTLKKAPVEEQARALNLNAVITSLVNMFRGSLAREDHISIETRLDPALPELVCREDALRQIITNLVKNAAEALEAGGTIEILTAGNVYMDGQRFVQLVVRDNGPGMDAAILDRLFTPGSSTKGGNHTGSGLAIVHNLVKNLRGQVTCRTNSQELSQNCDAVSATGTEFAVLLPVSAPSGAPSK